MMDHVTMGQRLRAWAAFMGMEAASGLLAAIIVLLIWVATGANDYFWPRWVWFALALIVGGQAAIRLAARSRAGRRRIFAFHIASYCILAPSLVTIWAFAGGGYFWPIWALSVLSIALGTHVFVLSKVPDPHEHQLSERIDVLTRTRRTAIDSQAAELQRIERDLHDGAQARLVSLGMNLGMAQQIVRSDPDAAVKLLAEARAGTLAALDDLRTVMQTIHPSVLADRGLVGAVQALALDLALPVSVTSELTGSAPTPVESALYFAIAECLANVMKHSLASSAVVHLGYADGRLRATVRDDGNGGARLDAGTGLAGVVRRLEAFDGALVLTSPVGGPTTVTMEIPCALSSQKTSPSSETA